MGDVKMDKHLDIECNVQECLKMFQELNIHHMISFDWFGIVTIIKKNMQVRINGAIRNSLTEDSIVLEGLESLKGELLKLDKPKIFNCRIKNNKFQSLLAVSVKDFAKYRVFIISTNFSEIYTIRDAAVLCFVTKFTYENIVLNEKVIREKNYLHNVLESAEVSIITLDLQGIIITANQFSTCAFDFLENVQGKSLYECVVEKERERLQRTVNHVIQRNKTFTVRSEFFYTSQGTKIINSTFSPLNDGQGQVIGVVIITTDITREKILERELEQIKQFAILGELATGIAHDIKNPLMSIRGCARLLEEDVTLQQQEFVEPIIKEVDKINEVIEQMLNFARISERNIYRDVNINEILHKCLNFIRFRRSAKHIKFETNFESSISNIKGNAIQLQQAFINILLNSVQAIPDCGKIGVSTDLSEDKKMIKITISDTGIGIPAEIINKIFIPFYSTKEEGTGLGLAIVESVVKKHHGKINFTSREKAGTTCKVYLPYEGVNDI